MGKFRKKGFVIFTLVFVMAFLISCINRPDETSNNDVTVTVTIQFPTTYTMSLSNSELENFFGKKINAFEDELPVSNIYLNITDSDGVRQHEGIYKPNEKIRVKLYVQSTKKYTFNVEIATNATMYTKETVIMKGSVTTSLSKGTTVNIPVDFLDGSVSLNVIVPDTWLNEYVIKAVDITIQHAVKGTKKTFTKADLDATQTTFEITDLYPGLWQITQSATLTNTTYGNIYQTQKTGYLMVYPSLNIPFSTNISIYNAVRFSKTLNGNAKSSVAVSKDGTIYVATDQGYLYAFADNGTEKWSVRLTTSAIYSGPVLDEEGYIYVGAEDKKVYKIDPSNGQKIWEYTSGGNVSYGLALDNSQVYFGASDGNLYAVKRDDGQLVWTRYLGNAGYFSHPSIGDDGTVYIVAGKLYAFTPDGTLKWQFNGDGYLQYGPTIDSDGKIYVASAYYLYAVSRDGRMIWEHHYSYYSSNYNSSEPVIGLNGLMYISRRDYLLCLNTSDGSKKWDFYLSYYGYSKTPLVDEKNRVYVLDSYGVLRIFDGDNGQKLWEKDLGDSGYTSPAISTIGEEKTILVGVDNKLYSIHTLSKGLAKTNWPKMYRDEGNSSNVNTEIITSEASITTYAYLPIVPPVTNLSAEYDKFNKKLKVSYQWNITSSDFYRPKFLVYAKLKGEPLWIYVGETSSKTGVEFSNVYFFELEKVAVNTVLDLRESGFVICTPVLK
ncbi:PQQ-binding-like beta-propeller repeat protein [Fervidobacterium islandicum]|uniref:PQQ-binding-like beta-propeller repeat protein n=1 Tax=Fervidobacterium islandicum TaxID=2423 RepID=A0AAI8CML5_FERIS|nr:PQQ-binding-like beta-propeller repeat protein [Fervidobacterium islandicum]AMW33265.1 PQQ-binding-like beta-propeller repeat protein [Fervidobacterium islandicum]